MRSIWIASVLLGLAVAAAPAAAQQEPSGTSAQIDEIRAFETRYLQTVDDGDVVTQLALVSRDPDVSSILDGESWRGWEAIKAQAEAYVPVSKLVRNVVDRMEVVPLASDLALVVIDVHSVKVDPAKQSFPDMAGVLTHVLRRTPEGWRMLHEHFSTKLTPEFIAFQAALVEARKKGAGKMGADLEPSHAAAATSASIERKTCTAPDGVELVYSASGKGSTGLVFIHGGLANRGFWDHELAGFADRYRVIALDLPGHGESGSNRKKWGIPEFGADARAVVEAERLDRVVLFGNSLGGPVAVEAALQLPGKARGVVGVDTFFKIDHVLGPEDAKKQAESFRADYPGMVRQMVKRLLHPDTDPAFVADVERRMMGTPPDAAYAMFIGMGGYDSAAAVRRLQVPLHAICGDLYPVDVEGNRRLKPDFEVVVMKHVGHYPMLERPDEFDRLVAQEVEKLL